MSTLADDLRESIRLVRERKIYALTKENERLRWSLDPKDRRRMYQLRAEIRALQFAVRQGSLFGD